MQSYSRGYGASDEDVRSVSISLLNQLQAQFPEYFEHVVAALLTLGDSESFAMAAYPLVPKDEVGFRIQVTAANTDEEIDHLIEVLGSLRDRFQLHQGASATAKTSA